MDGFTLTRLRERLAWSEALLGCLSFFFIAVAGTAFYFAALLMWAHRADECVLASVCGLLMSAGAYLTVAAIEGRQANFLTIARNALAGTKWIAADGREITAEDVRLHDLAIGERHGGMTVFTPRELLRPKTGDQRAEKLAFAPGNGLAERKALLAEAAGRHWKSGFAIGVGSVFVAVPVLAGISHLTADPLPLRVVIGCVFLGGCAYAIARFSKAARNDELAAALS